MHVQKKIHLVQNMDPRQIDCTCSSKSSSSHINPLTARVVGAPQMILQPIFSIFPRSPLPSGTCRIQASLFPDVVFPPLPLSALSFSPVHCALQDGFGQTWWTGNMTIPLQFASLYDQEIFMWSNCLLDLSTDFLVGNMVFVWDVEYLAVTPHFQGLYSSLELCSVQSAIRGPYILWFLTT